MAKGNKVIMPGYYAVLLSSSYITELCCHVNVLLLSFLIKKIYKLHLVFNCYHISILYLYM